MQSQSTLQTTAWALPNHASKRYYNTVTVPWLQSKKMRSKDGSWEEETSTSSIKDSAVLSRILPYEGNLLCLSRDSRRNYYLAGGMPHVCSTKIRPQASSCYHDAGCMPWENSATEVPDGEKKDLQSSSHSTSQSSQNKTWENAKSGCCNSAVVQSSYSHEENL